MSAGPSAPELDALLQFIKERRGFDFTGYKRSSIQRRVAKRMAAVGVEDHEEYLDHLQLHDGEFAALFDTLLINVTGFFRDAPTWDDMASTIVPRIVAERPAGAPIRVWCPGCASGEEAYTVAMVLARVMGDADFCDRVKIYATDVDEAALEQARSGAYLPRQVQDIPHDARERFFERTDQRYVFRRDLRRCIIFGRNNLVQDAPISRIDLLVCRNTLMYFTAETQSEILRRFHFALDDAGVLLLGRSEMLVTHGDLFTPIEPGARAFRKVGRRVRRIEPPAPVRDPGHGAAGAQADSLREAVFDLTGDPHIVLDAGGTLVMANAAARRSFDLSGRDIGRPIQDLELSYRPVELRAQLEHVAREARPVELSMVPWRIGGRDAWFDVRIVPLRQDGAMLGVSIVYGNATIVRQLETDLAASQRELDQAFEQLQSTVEELETTNEELHSINEELETTNEDLQSTNQELETLNEELQSANGELETINDELRHRTGELDGMNAVLARILTTMGLAVVVIDRHQHVKVWNTRARELWGVGPGAAEDQHLLSLDGGLPVEQLKRPVRVVLAGESDQEELTLSARDRGDQATDCRVRILPLAQDGAGAAGAILIMEPVG